MSDKKYSFRSEIKYENQRAREDRAIRGWKRNNIGLLASALVFFCVLLATLNGYRLYGNLSMLAIVFSMMGLFYFGRELRILPKGQLIFSSVKALLCLAMAGIYAVMHRGLWNSMDFLILAVLVGVVLIDIPHVVRACKALKA